MSQRFPIAITMLIALIGCSGSSDREVGSIEVGDAPNFTKYVLGTVEHPTSIIECKTLSVKFAGDWIEVGCETVGGGNFNNDYPRERVRTIGYISREDAARRRSALDTAGPLKTEYSSK